MRARLRTLAITGALTMSVATAAPTQDAPAAATAVPASDIKTALTEIRKSWRDFNGCDRQNLCGVYFDTFGVALEFNDGTIAPFAHERRHLLSSHDCVVKAREALDHGDRGLAVQWIMAAQELNPPQRAWVSDHPDAVVAALHQCCS